MKIYFTARNKIQQGATLIEVMIGILILVIMAVAVPAGLAYPRFLVISAAHKQAAIHAANEVLEKTFSMNYSHADLVVGTTALATGDQYTLNGRSITVTRTVEVLGGGGGSLEYKRITVFVSYFGGDAPVVLETFITP